MNRRDAIGKVALMMGGVISAPTLVAILDGCKSNPSTNVFALDTDSKSLLAELCEIIIPKTDTPGASEAGVGPFIEKMLRDCYSTVQQEHFTAGLKTVTEEASKLGGSFVSLSDENKIAVMNTMLAKAKEEAAANATKAKAKVIDAESGAVKENQKGKDEVEVPTPFFTILKELTTFGYFTSEVGATQALDFVPIPGRWDACIPLKEGQKAYAYS